MRAYRDFSATLTAVNVRAKKIREILLAVLAKLDFCPYFGDRRAFIGNYLTMAVARALSINHAILAFLNNAIPRYYLGLKPGVD